MIAKHNNVLHFGGRCQQTLNLSMILFGFTFFSGSMIVGAEIAHGATLRSLLMAVIIGGMVLGLFGGILAFVSCRERMDTHDMIKCVFGERGSKIVGILIALTQIGWFGVGGTMFARPLSQIFKMDETGKSFLGIFFCIIMTVSAAIGIRGITVVSYAAVPIILLGGIASIGVAFNENLVMDLSATDSYRHLAWASNLVVGTYIAGSITVPNFTYKFYSPIRAGVIAFCAFFLGNGLMILFGAASWYITGGTDIFDLIVYLGYPLIGMIVLGLNIWSSCDNGLYSAGIEIGRILRKETKILVCICGVLGAVMSRFIFIYLLHYLQVMNEIFPPIATIIILNFYMKRGHNKAEAIISAGLGVFVGILLNAISFSSLIGIVVSMFSFITLCHMRKLN